ncbi:arsenite methyltransferase [Methanocalculus taiwanensis]|uniref:Arsenite methyltransferase n=1 Tax=Methanocalculus taiwanensis TaxID=106207 RepID=A0ABD4TN05_9EURY|nr:arsenite methyltransferase [Methanocalculus taiwanensis]MCQ1539002.1 arsenite methyltransferase [Methanocalculus taiwanensis]
MTDRESTRRRVRERYGKVAREGGFGCGCGPGCCDGRQDPQSVSASFGYSDEEQQAVPKGANLGLGCGNPVALASLKEGDTVLDLGSGAGFDCFLASQKVGASGHVIGVDMTVDMLEKARRNAQEGGYANVEFRLGEIEHLPVADASVDVVISNCVINLSVNKPQVFSEIFRVLRPGGRLLVSDIVLTAPLPDAIKNSSLLYTSCVSGALLKEEYQKCIHDAGFSRITIYGESVFPLNHIISEPELIRTIGSVPLDEAERKRLSDSIVSIKIGAEKKM